MFRETGEIWGVSSSFFSEHDEEVFFSYGYAAERWKDWLAHSIRVSEALGGAGPFEIKLGLDGTEGVDWPRRSGHFDPKTQAIENGFELGSQIISQNNIEITEIVRAALSEAAGIFGLPPFSVEEFIQALR